ncbi:hypothetical protein FACS189430_09700 [Bacteroidia bacterium]|nr:hypothetical protein FACS189430_09700 [Bacteroidia bacterium]
MKKLLVILLGLISLNIISKSQTPYYYYYNGNKQYLVLDTKHAFISVKEAKTLIKVDRFKVKSTGLKPYNVKSKSQSSDRFWTELEFEENLSEEQYQTALSSIKRSYRDVIVSPYFKIKENDKIGLSNFFYVKLKSLADTTVLIRMANKTQTIILKQDSFMPLWYVLSTTNQSEVNAMEMANLFSALF